MALNQLLEKVKKSNLSPSDKIRSIVYLCYISSKNNGVSLPRKSDIWDKIKNTGYFDESNKYDKKVFDSYEVKPLKYIPYELLSLFIEPLECATSKITPLEISFYYHDLLTRWKDGTETNLLFTVQYHLNKVNKEDKKEYDKLIKKYNKTKSDKERISKIENDASIMYANKHYKATKRKITRNKICFINAYLIKKGLLIKDTGSFNQSNKILFLESNANKIISIFSSDQQEVDKKDLKIQELEKQLKIAKAQIEYQENEIKHIKHDF